MHSGRVVKNNEPTYGQRCSRMICGFVFFATWHSIEVQYEGCHESSLDGEDGDGVGEHHSVGVVEPDDHQLGQGEQSWKNYTEKERKSTQADLFNIFTFQVTKFSIAASGATWSPNFQLMKMEITRDTDLTPI